MYKFKIYLYKYHSILISQLHINEYLCSKLCLYDCTHKVTIFAEIVRVQFLFADQRENCSEDKPVACVEVNLKNFLVQCAGLFSSSITFTVTKSSLI